MKVENPIFIVGVGRSGSTIFHRIFSAHPQVAWLSSRLCNKYPNRPGINGLLMRAIDYPVIGSFMRRRFATGEGYEFWEHHCRGFSEPCRDLLASDATFQVKKTLPYVMAKVLTPQRHRLLIKITGWPRLGFLQEIFPNAIFIHIRRDRRAVINSLIKVDFWSGWRGPQNWRWGELTRAQIEEWERFDRSFVALAGIELDILASAMQTARQRVPPGNFLEVEYEALCENTVGIFREVVEFCELDWSMEFENAIKKYSVSNTNYKWREDLTCEQQKIAEYYFAKQNLHSPVSQLQP